MDRKRVSLELGATAPIAIADQCTNRLRHLKLHWNLHTSYALSFYVTKTVLVGPKWFWSDQIDLDLTIMILS